MQGLAYTYGDISGDAGNIRAIADALAPARDQIFDYDALYRLTAADGAYGAIDYAYDAVGNRTSRVITTGGTVTETLTYDSASNRLLTVADGTTTRTLGYTANGQVTSDSRGLGFAYLYNHADRLATLQENSVTVATYTHNDIGERVIKTVGAAVTHYVFDLSGTLVAEADGTGVTAREYIHIDGLPLGMVVGTTLYFVHPDHLGAPQKITDATKAVVWDGQFTPFGQVHSITGALVANWRLPGQYHDAEAQLSYNYRRTYDPALGRYLQSDPIGLAGGLNTYSYGFNSPVMLTDPTGEIIPLIPLLLVGTVDVVGAVALRVAVRIGARVVVRWLTPAFLKRIAPLWARLGITFDVMDVAEFGFVVADPDSSAGDIAAAGMGLALSIADPTRGNLLKKGGNATAKLVAKMPPNKAQLDHIFDASKINKGHIAPQTQASQDRAGRMFENVANDPGNRRLDLVKDPNKQKTGIEIFTKNQNNGQIWVETKNGIIQDAGVNRLGNFR